jgi:hypothetical protein
MTHPQACQQGTPCPTGWGAAHAGPTPDSSSSSSSSMEHSRVRARVVGNRKELSARVAAQCLPTALRAHLSKTNLEHTAPRTHPTAHNPLPTPPHLACLFKLAAHARHHAQRSNEGQPGQHLAQQQQDPSATTRMGQRTPHISQEGHTHSCMCADSAANNKAAQALCNTCPAPGVRAVHAAFDPACLGNPRKPAKTSHLTQPA